MSSYYQPIISLQDTGARIRYIRKSKKLTVQYIVDAIGLGNNQSVYDWEKGKCLPRIENLLALSRVLEIPINSILVCDDEDAVVFLIRLRNRLNDICAP